MTIEEIESKATYLFTCKDNYAKSIRPANPETKNTDGYKLLVDIAKTYFLSGQTERFSDNFQESQYLVNLWTAHLIIEYGLADKSLTNKCLTIIKDYSTTPLNETLAKEETIWLHNYIKINGDI